MRYFVNLYITRMYKKYYQQNIKLFQNISLSFSEETIDYITSMTHSSFPWTEFTKWMQNDTVVLLYPSSGSPQVIPTRLFTEDGGLEELESFLIKTIGPQAG